MKLIQFKLSILILLIFHTDLIYASFEELGPSVRAIAMGNSFVAITGDVDSIFYNPAGLAKLKTMQVSSVYAQIATQIEGPPIADAYAVFGTPLKSNRGVFSSGWASRNFMGFYSEDTYSLGYARYINKNSAVGVTTKLLRITYQGEELANIPLFQERGNTTQGYAVDVGLIGTLTPQLNFGVSIKNVISPNMALTGEEKPAQIIRVGMVYDMKPKVPSLVSFEFNNQQVLNELNCGTELDFLKSKFKLRAGINYAPGERGYTYLTGGFGIKFTKLNLSYAVAYPVDNKLQGNYTHRFGLSFEF